jgi:predicted transcriptional regulator
MQDTVVKELKALSLAADGPGCSSDVGSPPPGEHDVPGAGPGVWGCDVSGSRGVGGLLMASSLDAARRYAARGWSVIPLLPHSKRPAVPSWKEFQSRKPSEEEMQTWWGEHPDWGVAIVTGRVSNLVVVDIDPRNGGDVEAARRDCPTGMVVATGGGGRHLFCRYPETGAVASGRTNRPGVDRKADGGYVVAPPSIHPETGAPYCWLAEGQPGALAAWVLESPQAVSLDTIEVRPRWIAETLAHPELVEPGTQDETLTRLAYYLSSKHDHDVAVAILRPWAERLRLGRPNEPWTVQHIEAKLKSAYRRRASLSLSATLDDLARPGVAGGAPTMALDRRILEKLEQAVRTAPEYVEQVAATARGVDWIVEELVAPASFTELIGTMKEGKTTFVCAMLRALFRGEPFLGRATKPTPVLYLSEQAGRSLAASLERGQIDGSSRLHLLTIADLQGMEWDDAAAAVVHIAQKRGCGLIIVDTLARLAKLEDEADARSVECLNPFLRAKALGIAVLFVRHARKAGGPANVAGRGTGAITGEMDICLHLTAPQGVASNYRHLEGISRLTDMLDVHLTYADGTYVLGDPPTTTKQQQKDGRAELILGVLSQHPLTPVTVSMVAARTNLPARTVRRYLQEMRQRGQVTVDQGGGYRLQVPEVHFDGGIGSNGVEADP